MITSLKKYCSTWSDDPSSWSPSLLRIGSVYKMELKSFITRHTRLAIQLDILKSEPQSSTLDYQHFFDLHLKNHKLFKKRLVDLVPFPLEDDATVLFQGRTLLCPGYTLLCIKNAMELLLPYDRYQVTIHHKDCYTMEVRQVLWSYIGNCLDQVPNDFYGIQPPKGWSGRKDYKYHTGTLGVTSMKIISSPGGAILLVEKWPKMLFLYFDHQNYATRWRNLIFFCIQTTILYIQNKFSGYL